MEEKRSIVYFRRGQNVLLLTAVCFVAGMCYYSPLVRAAPPIDTDLCKNFNCTCVNTTTRKTIHCEGRLQGALSREIFVPLDFTEIDFSNCEIPAIHSNTFQGIYLTTTLSKIDFSNNQIEYIEDGAFEMFIGIRELNLRRNRIENLTIAMFRGLRQLETLDLSYNNIQSVDMDVLLPCISLKTLNLRYNRLSLSGLQDLLISASTMLENLDLHGVGLDRLPADLFLETSYIRRLILSSNNLGVVPGNALSKLRLLTVLDLSDNLISAISSIDFEGSESLEELYLNSMNQLVYIGERAFHTLKKLKIFSCSYNSKLRAIHPSAFTGYNISVVKDKFPLQEVRFRQNALKSLDEKLLPWGKIRYVDLAENSWHCDCSLGWMASIRWDLKRAPQIICETPRPLRGRFIYEIPPQSFLCIDEMDSHMAASIVLLLSTLFLLSLGFCFFACWKLSWFNTCRAKFQKRYHTLKPPPENSTIEVELKSPSDDSKQSLT